ncbi:MAG: hydantoinase B/oxoprolinase family protein, partial [Chloroflexota bacterium]|nr:hydantoinase B/oxoprolinase family protein [Chloroflexota bacterium]
RTFRDELEPGDIVMLNDPFNGGTHLPDVYVFSPVFHQGQLIALIATVAHHADLGGMAPGSMSPHAEECYQEGLRIPPVKFYERGEPNAAVHALIRANCRIPEVVLGDFAAQVVALRTGEAGFLKLVEAYGHETLIGYLRDLLDYTEALTRAEIRSLPDGIYHYVDYLDDDGVHPEHIPIEVKITIRDDEIEADFEGTSPQLAVPLNSTLSFTKSCVYYALRTLMRTDIPHNAGFFRAITVKAPRGSILNCILPAATATRGLTGFRVADAVFGALAEALPERVMGASDGGLTLVGLAGRRARRDPFTVLELLSGAWGGRSDRDGLEGVPNLGANISNIPVEMLEAAYPVRIEQYGFVPDTGGAGRFRGGLSTVRDYRLLQDAILTVRADRQRILPYGVAGGCQGTPSVNVLNPETEPRKLPSKFGEPVKDGDLFRHLTAGAGGWGNPLERAPAAVARDVWNGKLSAEYARRQYRVVLTEAGEVDAQATSELRRQSVLDSHA